MSTTKQTERGTDSTDYPIVTRSLLIFSMVFYFYGLKETCVVEPSASAREGEGGVECQTNKTVRIHSKWRGGRQCGE